MPFRVLILPDLSTARRERSLLERLEIGLADEGVRVAHAVPASLAPMSFGGVYSTVVHYQDAWLALPGLPTTSSAGSLLKGTRATALVELLAEAMPPERDRSPVQVVHCFGTQTWQLGRAVAELTSAALVLDVHDAPMVFDAAGFATGGGDRTALNPTLAMSDPGLLALAPRTLRAGLAPWGVHLPETPENAATSAATPTGEGARLEVIAIVASGRQAKAVQAAVEGLGAVIGQLPEEQRPMVLVDAILADRCPVYRTMAKMGLTGHLCEVIDLEGQRAVLAEADVILMPESLGEQRSSVLEAMAAGTTVIAQADPHNSTLVEGVTARLISPGARGPGVLGVGAAAVLGGRSQAVSAGHWAELLRGVLFDEPRRRSLGVASAKWVGENRLASSHVRATLELYRAALAARAANTATSASFGGA